jgi:uncharacterized protein
LGSEVARHLQPLVSEALTDTRVVGIVGPRQAGKSTLAQRLVAMTEAATYVTFDDLAVRTTAEADPQGFVTGRPGLLAIDEVQRVPNLLLAIKAEVDRDQRPGRFLITGSAQLSATRGVSDTLAGRIERFELWPFSQSEVTATPATLVDRLLDGDIPRGYHSSTTKLDYLELAIAGGFPEALQRRGRRRSAWFDAYVEAVWSESRSRQPLTSHHAICDTSPHCATASGTDSQPVSYSTAATTYFPSATGYGPCPSAHSGTLGRTVDSGQTYGTEPARTPV